VSVSSEALLTCAIRAAREPRSISPPRRSGTSVQSPASTSAQTVGHFVRFRTHGTAQAMKSPQIGR
jgi:hypothetical protein